MTDHAAIARLSAELGMSVPEVEELIASEAADLARWKRSQGDAGGAEAYDRLAAEQWAEAHGTTVRAAR